MRAHRTIIVFITVALASAVAAVPAGASHKRLTISGSTSMLPLVEKLAAAYHKEFKSIPAPKVLGGQTNVGISEVASGRVDIGDASRDPLESDPQGLRFYKIARDGVCLITNTSNPLENLSEETVQDIYTGAYTNWSQVPGAKVSGPIDLFDRDAAAGTQDAFQHIFLGEEKQITKRATNESSEGLEVDAVHADPKAIGFTSFAATINGGVWDVPYEGIPCTLKNAKSGQYLGVRNFWMVTKGPAKGEAAKFIAWVKEAGNKTVEKIISSEWISIH